jgi:hypothetical protein
MSSGSMGRSTNQAQYGRLMVPDCFVLGAQNVSSTCCAAQSSCETIGLCWGLPTGQTQSRIFIMIPQIFGILFTEYAE